jgi:predicted GNAT family acetyltransferase
MNTAFLDRPIWHALSTRLSAFAEGDGRALRFRRDVNLFAAAKDDSAESLAALTALLPSEGYVILLQAGRIVVPPGAVVAVRMPGVQMVAAQVEPLSPPAHVVPLTEADGAEMLALATLTQPGPFLARTHELGGFWGVKENGKLIAMAGERFKVPGFTEVSGVCTHSDARGRGYGGELSRVVAGQIMARGETPMLHAVADNTTAIRLYETLGFRLRCEVDVVALVREGAASAGQSAPAPH